MPKAAIGWPTGTPEASLRGSGAGSSTGAPEVVAAITGAGPTKASWRASSPLRKRWHRTPPVPRPLPGYSLKGVTLTEPASVPGRAEDAPAHEIGSGLGSRVEAIVLADHHNLARIGRGLDHLLGLGK